MPVKIRPETSFSQYSITSISDKVVLLPKVTHSKRPTPVASAQSNTLDAIAPDCDKTRKFPLFFTPAPNVAFIGVLVFINPKQLGPNRFKSCFSTSIFNSFSKFLPSSPASLYPAVYTTTFFIPFSPLNVRYRSLNRIL